MHSVEDLFATITMVPPDMKLPHTWVERGSVRVKCLAQEQNTMPAARAPTRTARSGVERTNHEAKAPPTTYQGFHLRLEAGRFIRSFFIPCPVL